MQDIHTKSNNVMSLVYDDHFVRYRLVKSNSREKSSFNWIFLPGGPGADSSYYLSLIDHLDQLGNFWLMDFPANGDNFQSDIDGRYDFNQWETCFIPALKRFDNPILVGQSFGGMFPLLFPELENILKGFVILNSAPTLWLSEAANYAKVNNISTFSDAGAQFRNNPTEETFRAALQANAHCHFTPKSLAIGKKMFERLPFNYKAMLWWIKKAQEINFDAKWIPKKIPTLIMGGTHDFITPCHLFQNDKRFHRDNIEMKIVLNAGHFLWLDHMSIVKEAFTSFFIKITNFSYFT